MGIGVSLFLMALGAILTFAVHVTSQGLDINTIGVILMLVGALGLLASLVFWSDLAPWGTPRRSSRLVYDDVDTSDDVYVRGPRPIIEAPVRRRRTVYRRQDVV